VNHVTIIQNHVTVSSFLYPIFILNTKNQAINTKKMKKIKSYLLITIVLVLVMPITLKAEGNEPEKAATEKVASATASTLMNRLEEIKAMDKSNMSSVEKKALRKEVRSIKKSLKEVGGGVYLSVGAIIIIVLLLILLL